MDNNTYRELQALDEALEYLNEGKLLDKLKDIFKQKKKNSKTNTTKDTFSYYEYYKSIFKNAVESYRNGTLIDTMVKAKYSYTAGAELAYLDLPQTKFDSMVKKYIKYHPNKVHSDDEYIYDWTDHDETVTNMFRNNDNIVIATEEMYFLYYFIDGKYFYLFDTVHYHRSEKYNYSQFINYEKSYMLDDPDAVQADADLGYYLLSEPPAGEKKIKL